MQDEKSRMRKMICGTKRKLGFLLLPVFIVFASCGSNNDEKGESYTSPGISDTSSETKAEDFSAGSDTPAAKSGGVTSSDWLLIPGVSAGQTKIDENAEEVYKRLGRPDGGDAAMQKAVAIWFSNHDSSAHSIAIYTARSTDSAAIARILQIRITSPSFITKDSIHTGSSLSAIQSKYAVKQTETYRDANADYKVFDCKEGIAFEVNGNNKCVAIIVHKSGITGESTYLKFRTTNKFIDRKK